MDTTIPQNVAQCAFDFDALSMQSIGDLRSQINPAPQQSYPLKFCAGCNQHKPATKQFFWSDKTKSDHLTTLCKVCKSPEGKVRRDREKALNAPPEGFRKCTACKGIKPATAEYFDLRDAKQGTLHSECKPCKAARWQRDLAKKPGYWRNMYQKDAEYHKARVRNYYRLHAQDRAAYARNYYWQNVEQCRERAKIDAKKHPERYRAHANKRRAFKKQSTGTHTQKDIQAQYQRQHGKCYYCDKKLEKYHVDHIIPLSRGGSNSPSNLVVACPTCNLKKHDKLLHEWLEGGRLC